MSYTRVNWQDAPSVSTPLSASNLNKMDAGIKQNADDIAQLQQRTYDAELNDTSTNAPQTKAVYEALQELDIETDTTLSVSGKAADAAATGEAVNQLKKKIGEVTVVQNLFDVRSVVSGGYYGGSGQINDSTNSHYSTQYIAVEAGVSYTFTASSDDPYYIATYNSSKTFVARQNPTGNIFTPDTGVAFIRFSIYNKSFPDGFKFAKTADFLSTSSDRLLLNGLKIKDAPYSPVILDTITTDVITSTVMTYGGNYYPGSNGDKTALATQYWYEMTALVDFELWTNPDITYHDLIIAVYNNGTATRSNFVARYRKNSDTDTLPTSSSKLSITAGQLFVVSAYLDSVFEFLSTSIPTGYDVFKQNILLNAQQINQVNGLKVVPGNGYYDITFDKFAIRLTHVVNASTRADLWNITSVTKDGAKFLASGTDILGVVRETGESDYMGGVHGDETNATFYILADGSQVTDEVMCSQVDILMHSHLTRVSTGDNVLDRYVHIVIRKNVIEVETTFKCLVDNFNVQDALAGGMWAWYEADKIYAMSNIGAISGSGSSGTSIVKMHDLYTVTAVLTSGVATCENIIGKEVEGTTGQAYYYGNEKNPRMKMYLGQIQNIEWNTGDTWKGKSRYTMH